MQKIIFVASHGKFAEELVKSAEMIIGEVSDCYAFSLLPDKGIDDFSLEIENKLQEFEGREIICLVDLFGGTPCFASINLLQSYDFKVVTGLNLAMLIEVASNRDGMTLDQLACCALETLNSSGKNLNDYIKGV